MSDSDDDIAQFQDELQDELRELQEQLGISYKSSTSRRVNSAKRLICGFDPPWHEAEETRQSIPTFNAVVRLAKHAWRVQVSAASLETRRDGEHRALAQEWEDLDELLQGDAAVASGSAAAAAEVGMFTIHRCLLMQTYSGGHYMQVPLTSKSRRKLRPTMDVQADAGPQQQPDAAEHNAAPDHDPGLTAVEVNPQKTLSELTSSRCLDAHERNLVLGLSGTQNATLDLLRMCDLADRKRVLHSQLDIAVCPPGRR